MQNVRLHFSKRVPALALVCAGSLAVMLAAAGFGPSRPSGQTASVRTSDLWIVPASGGVDGAPGLAEVVLLIENGKPEDALRALSEASYHPDLAGYARLFEARALAALERHGEALDVASRLLGGNPAGSLREAALWTSVEAAELAERWPAAVDGLQALVAAGVPGQAEVLLRLARALEKTGDVVSARAAYERLYYEMPVSAQAADAGKALLAAGVSLSPTTANWKRTYERAERLFAGRRSADARAAFVSVRGLVHADARPRLDLRLAQCDLQLGRHAVARPAFEALTGTDAPAEIARDAAYYRLGTLRAIGPEETYVGEVDRFVEAHADHALAETALNDLGTHYILKNEDGKAASVFRRMYDRYPTGAFADRAAWKAGWWAYKNGEYAETIRLFESAAVGLRRADYRPSWLYWAARSHAHRGEREAAADGYRRTIGDYRNSYYGRQAARELESLERAVRPAGAGSVAPAARVLPPTIDPGAAPANATLVEQLLQAGLYEEAAAELRHGQRTSGVTSPRIEATLAYALNRQGQLRPAITTMRRAYPQFMAAGGEALPREILTVIFPVDYTDLIRKYAAAHKLDPHLMTALVAQESTFQADVRSVANAWGLMQIIPATGRRYARTLGISPFSTRRLTDPEVNVRIGMKYFAELLARFGDPAPALAAYNAGENRVARWLSERPGIARDEFIDDIPFPETQNYVKRILGTAEDYRLLYGAGTSASGDRQP